MGETPKRAPKPRAVIQPLKRAISGASKHHARTYTVDRPDTIFVERWRPMSPQTRWVLRVIWALAHVALAVYVGVYVQSSTTWSFDWVIFAIFVVAFNLPMLPLVLATFLIREALTIERSGDRLFVRQIFTPGWCWLDQLDPKVGTRPVRSVASAYPYWLARMPEDIDPEGLACWLRISHKGRARWLLLEWFPQHDEQRAIDAASSWRERLHAGSLDEHELESSPRGLSWLRSL